MKSQSQLDYEDKQKILATQVDLLDQYNPRGRRKRMTELKAIPLEMPEQNPSYHTIDSLIQKYDFCLSLLRSDHPETENDPEVKGKLEELSRRLLGPSSGSFRPSHSS